MGEKKNDTFLAEIVFFISLMYLHVIKTYVVTRHSDNKKIQAIKVSAYENTLKQIMSHLAFKINGEKKEFH